MPPNGRSLFLNDVKILFFSHDGKLGDAVVNTAFLNGLAQLDPTAEVHVLASTPTADFWAMNRRVKKVWAFENPPLIQCLKTSFALRRERFDFIVTWKERFKSEKTRLMLFIASPKRGILYEEGKIAGATAHAVRKCRESLRLIYGERAERIEARYQLELKPDDGNVLAQLPSAAGEVILFNMFSAEAPKTIGIAEAADVLSGLARLAPEATLCLSCTDATADRAARAVAASGAKCRLVNTEKNLRGLISLCERADLVVTTDTSLIHIASALDRPVLGIYLNDPAKATQWAPLSRHAEVVTSPYENTVNGFSIADVLVKVQRLRNLNTASAPAA
jgi:ADP-heptose:LPS heptosyltransferase